VNGTLTLQAYVRRDGSCAGAPPADLKQPPAAVAAVAAAEAAAVVYDSGLQPEIF